MLWLIAASAAELVPLGFSPTGALVSFAEVEPAPAGVHARVLTWDVARSTWNHFPAEADGVDAAAAIRAALATVRPGYAVLPADRIDGAPRATLTEGSRDHSHLVPHRTTWRPDGVAGVFELVEVPDPACAGGGVEPWVAWLPDGGTATPLTADRNPRRWPTCTAAYDLARVETGPRGAVIAVWSALVPDGDTFARRWLVATARLPTR